MNLYVASFLFLLVHFVLRLTTSYILEKAPNIEARMILLYNDSITSMPDQVFQISFQTNFTSISCFTFGINHYRLGDRFYTQNFEAAETGVSPTYANITVTRINPTNPTLFSVSYIAVQNETNLFSYSYIYSNAENISSGSGDRSLQVYYEHNFTSNTTAIIPMVTGYYIKTSNYFQLHVTGSILSINNYSISISTTDLCFLLRVNVNILFAQESYLIAGEYFLTYGQFMYYSEDNTSTSFTETLNNYNTTEFILGIRGFSGQTGGKNITWGWEIINDTSQTATLLIEKYLLDRLYFSFLQIGRNITDTINTTDSTNSTNSTDNSTANDSNNTSGSNSTNITLQQEAGSGTLIAIIGLIIGVVVVSVVVFVICRCCRKNLVYTIPTNDKFKEMPTISL